MISGERDNCTLLGLNGFLFANTTRSQNLNRDEDVVHIDHVDATAVVAYGNLDT